LGKKWPVFYGTGKYIIVFITAATVLYPEPGEFEPDSLYISLK
jgi:hypothetical protein